MNKKLLFLLLMWAMIFNICALISCKHKCEYGDWKTQTEATCTEDGLMYRECSKCGQKETQTVSATGHSESEWIVDNEATCTVDGSKHTECTVCGQTIQTETISNIGHKWDDGKVTKEPTCTKNGEKTYTCSVCGDAKKETIPVNENHTYGDDAVKISEDGKTAMLDCECEACHKKLQSPYTGYIVKNNIAYQFENGSKKDIFNGEIVFNGNTYYVIDNIIQINVYIRIENNIYYYGETGVKSTDSITNKEVTDNSGNTYYVIDNIIQINVYIRIENNIYYYGETGVKSTESITNKEVTDNSGNTYYVVNNKVQTNVYVRIENNIYYYGETGVKSNDSLNNIKVTDNNGKTYYVINNIIQINVYIIIENHVYYFDTDGFMISNSTHNGYNFGETGALTGSNISIEIDDTIYEVNEGVVTLHTVCVDVNCEHICDICGKKSSMCVKEDDNAIWNNLIDSTCTTTGTLGHYHCDICGKDFDREKNELTNIVIQLKDHNYVNGYCTVCNQHEPSKGLAFTLSNDKTYYYVSGIGTCQDTDIVIPSTYEGLPVREIASNAFYNCTSLTSITIPSSVTSIGDSVFSGCSSLTSIEIPTSVTSIGKYAFNYCSSLTSIEIPSSVTSIGDSVFSGCSSLTSIEIPTSVTSIGKYAFHYCSSLTSIEIPSSVTSIEYRAFYVCSSLTNVYYNGTIEDWCNIKFHSYYEGNDPSNPMSYAQHFYMKDSNKEYKEVTEIVIPDTITRIGIYKFDGFNNVTKITIPSSVTSIESYAFKSCSSLLTIINNSDLELTIGSTDNGYIAYYAYKIINKDGSITYKVDDTYTYIETKDNFIFRYDSNNNYQLVAYSGTIDTVSLPENINGNSYEIYKIKGVRNVIIPDTFTNISDFAFYYSSSLTSIEIPSSVTSIGNYAFRGCSSLTSITLPFIGETKDTNTYLGYIFGATSKNDNLVYVPKSLKEVIILEGCTNIGEDTFYNCSSLTSIEIPSSVTSIGSSAFYYCSSLTSIEIPSSVTSIGDGAFECCSSLTNIEISLSVTSIESWAFSGCSSLTSITIPSSVTSIGYSAFYGCNSLTSIEIPSSVTSIGEGAFSNTAYYNNESNWEDGVLYIGNHLIKANTSISSRYIIKDGTLTIADSAFSGCSSLDSIEIPSSVTSIGYAAFRGCKSLTIYCEASNKPSGWNSYWNYNNRPVVWNYKNNK